MQSPDKVELTDEDVATVKKCRQLSFWRGSVPFTVGSVLTVTVAQNYGLFTNRPKLRIPIYVLAVVAGYVAGKFSYLGECRRMFLELHDSRIKDFLQESNVFPHFGPGGMHPPVIVNTPVDRENKDSSKSMTYAERRAHHHRQSQFNSSDQLPKEEQPVPNTDVPPREPSAFLNPERPLGSYQFDDMYRPRD